jgi:TonB family protein
MRFVAVQAINTRSSARTPRSAVTRSLDKVFGLDEQAIKAASQWRFKPATRLGQPVSVYVTIAVGFTVR